MGVIDKRPLIAAWIVSVGLGLTFVFIRAPHPWGWEGFDNYRQLGLDLAHGEPYRTLEVPWGYPAFLAIFYRLFGDRQWIPLLVQVLLNSLVPLMVYGAMRDRVGVRDARLAAMLVGCFSFNTVYASTQTSDSLATVLFVAAVVLFMRAHGTGRAWTYGASGLVAGIAMQIRPNMLLLPLWLAGAGWMLLKPRPHPSSLAVYVVAAFAVIAPWTIRNARLTGRFIPASAHGGIQLWYGSLQVPPFFTHWFDNPRDVFGERTFLSTRPDGRNLVISIGEPIGGNCDDVVPRAVSVTYWTDRQPTRTTLPVQIWRPGGLAFELPPQPDDTEVYYYFDASWASPAGVVEEQTPIAAAAEPAVYFVTSNEFGDQDRHGDFVDVFDIVRLVRHEAWQEPIADASALDFDGDGALTRRDLDTAVGIIFSDKNAPIAVPEAGLVRTVTAGEASAAVEFRDGSTLTVPRDFSGRVLDLAPRGSIARGVLHTRRSFRSARLSAADLPAPSTFHDCHRLVAGMDTVFYRAQPMSQERYTQLALDNIRRTPGAYALACARRMAGIFITIGSDNPDAAHQFAGSRLLYLAGTVASISIAVMLVVGALIALRRGADVALLIAAVLYVPVTISPFLTNARYALSGQPFVFGFVAVALVGLYDIVRGARR